MGPPPLLLLLAEILLLLVVPAARKSDSETNWPVCATRQDQGRGPRLDGGRKSTGSQQQLGRSILAVARDLK